MSQAGALHWASPLPPAKSGVADYTAILVPHLARHTHLTLWTDQPDWDRRLEQWATIRRFEASRGLPDELKAAADSEMAPIVNLGNSPLHYGIWKLSRLLPNIAILHDVSLQHFFPHAFRDVEKNQDDYVNAMRESYGDRGAEAAVKFLRGLMPVDEISLGFPLAAYACGNSVAAIVHSEFSRKWVTRDGFAPALRLPFPYPSRRAAVSRTAEPPYRIVLCGYFGSNRLLDKFLAAFASFPRRMEFRVDIYGTVWDPAYVDRLISEGGVAGLVTLHGYRPLDELDELLGGAHLAVNLRYPTMGEASMSQLQIWDSGIATMVTPVGWYGEQPPETVLPVRPSHEEEDIHKHLDHFLQDPDEVMERGRRGKALLATRHDPGDYAAQLCGMARSWRGLAAQRAAAFSAARTGQIASDWMGEEQFQRWSRHLAQRIAETYTEEISR